MLFLVQHVERTKDGDETKWVDEYGDVNKMGDEDLCLSDDMGVGYGYGGSFATFHQVPVTPHFQG